MSLVELLSAVLVMLLVTSLLVLGVRIGTKAYVKSVSMSEAQILCATLTTLVTDELRYAGTIRVDTDGRVGFFSQNFGGADGADGADGAGVSYFAADENGQITLGGTPILSKRAYPYGLRAAVELSYAQPENRFTAMLTVCGADGGKLARTKFEVEPLNQAAESGAGT